jgi:undecaprenyl-diphosphatase
MVNLLINIFATYLIWIYLPVFVWLIFRRDKNTILRVVFAVLFATGISYLIKNIYYLPRPFITFETLPLVSFSLDGSMPSGHTAFSFAFSFAVFHRYKAFGLWLIVAGTLIAVGRITGGVHTPLDVFVGFFIALISHLLSKRILRH